MIRKIVVIFLVFIFLFGISVSTAYAVSEDEAIAIQSFIENARQRSRAPSISVAVTSQQGVYFFSSGVASQENDVLVNENTLYELASVSKAFTAFGILYLEEQGVLSLSDSIATYLPWLTLYYNGQPVDLQNVRLYHFLYHTVGITNFRHPNLVMSRSGPDTLQNTVEALIGAELVFFPGERMEYGTKNYNVLGLVIETVTGQSYESFMEEHIFQPLGLWQTFANRDHAEATGQLAQGYISNFVVLHTGVDSSEARGSVPCGYIISSTHDMARWMEIQLGLAEDIPPIFQRIIERFHEPDKSVPYEGMFGRYYWYAAGWFINVEQTEVQHGGNNPSFVSQVRLFPGDQIGITVLSNLNAVNAWSIADGVLNILEGDLSPRYSMGVMQIIDIILSIITVLGGLFAVLFFLLGLRRKRYAQKSTVSKKRIALIAFWLIMSLATCVLLFTFPMLIGRNLIGRDNWSYILSELSVSFITGLIALVVFCANVTWFVFSRKYAK